MRIAVLITWTAGIRLRDAWQEDSELYHRLRGSASSVLKATGFVDRKGQFSTTHRIDILQSITKNIVTADYVGDSYSYAKLRAHMFTGTSGHMGEI